MRNGHSLHLTYPAPRLIVAGRAVEAVREMEPVLNPATGEAISAVPDATDADLADTLADADAASFAWRTAEPAVRAQVLRAGAVLPRERRAAIAGLITLEISKPHREAFAENRSRPTTRYSLRRMRC